MKCHHLQSSQQTRLKVQPKSEHFSLLVLLRDLQCHRQRPYQMHPLPKLFGCALTLWFRKHLWFVRVASRFLLHKTQHLSSSLLSLQKFGSLKICISPELSPRILNLFLYYSGSGPLYPSRPQQSLRSQTQTQPQTSSRFHPFVPGSSNQIVNESDKMTQNASHT